jgi:hypothetical protein
MQLLDLGCAFCEFVSAKSEQILSSAFGKYHRVVKAQICALALGRHLPKAGI